MASKGKKTKSRRNNRLKKAGRDRKKQLGQQSTPAFPIHVPDHEEKATS